MLPLATIGEPYQNPDPPKFIVGQVSLPDVVGSYDYIFWSDALMLIKPDSTLLTIWLATLSSLTLIREPVRDGFSTALARARKTGWIFLNPHTFLRVATAIRFSETRPIVQAAPRLIFKYLGAYISMDLSRKERAAVLMDHYTFLRGRVVGDFFRNIVDSPLELWRHDVDEHTYRISLSFPRATHDEGDLALIFHADDEDLYTLSFSIGPGSVAGGFKGLALYISRVQGRARRLPLISKASKDCCDVAPAWILLAAAEGIATALEVRHMIGVGASSQISADKEHQTDLVKVYDEFWLASGGSRLDRNMFYLAVPPVLKPIQAIQRDHRRRALRKREFRRLVAEKVCRAYRDLALASGSDDV
jgi:uncharacterized protein VirK/YbjX